MLQQHLLGNRTCAAFVQKDGFKLLLRLKQRSPLQAVPVVGEGELHRIDVYAAAGQGFFFLDLQLVFVGK